MKTYSTVLTRFYVIAKNSNIIAYIGNGILNIFFLLLSVFYIFIAHGV
jgi:hypothetical protein